MAIAPMLKVTVLGYRPVLDEVVSALQRAGVLEIDAAEFELPVTIVEPDAETLRELDVRAADAHFLRDFLARYHVADHAMKAFVTEKFHLTHDEYFKTTFDTHCRLVHKQALNIFDEMAELEREAHDLHALIDDLLPWRDFRLQIERWQCTEHAVLFTGTVPAAECRKIRDGLREQVSEVTVEELGPIADRGAWVVIAHSSAYEEVRSYLATTNFTEVSFPDLRDYPAEEQAIAEERIAEIARRVSELESEAKALSDEHYANAVTLADVTQSARDRMLVQKNFTETSRSFAITGWVAEKCADQLDEALAEFGDDLDITYEPPSAEDSPPVELDNPWFIKPFEILTDLYGRPRYTDADPTPLLAPFFWLFFAICIGDVGYGAMLIAGAWLVKHRLDVGPGVRRFMDLVMFGGFGAMIVGVLLGGYFAVPADALPDFLLALRVMDPVADVQTFLLVALAIGVVQVFFGVLVAAVHAIKRGDTASAISDHLSIVFMFALITVASIGGVVGHPEWTRPALFIGILGTVVLQGRALPAALRSDVPVWDRGFGMVWVLGLIVGLLGYAFTGIMGLLWVLIGVNVFAVVSRAARSGLLAMLLGAYQVYGLTGVVGDVLSYLRLAALGLSSTLVGWVFNILTEMVWGGASPLFERGGLALIGGLLIAIAAVAVFTVGHVFNVVINLLGAFVHPARLQFVEFFGKFYEAGGRNHAPFAVRSENLVLGASGADQEGGGS